jgi:hypothetical protein
VIEKITASTQPGDLRVCRKINSVRPSGPQDDLPASAAQIRAGKDNFPSGPCDHALQPPHLLRTGTASSSKPSTSASCPAFAPVAAVRTHARPPLCAPASVYGIPPTPDRTGRAVAPAERCSMEVRGPRHPTAARCQAAWVISGLVRWAQAVVSL